MEDSFKIVGLTYTEQASIIVKAENNDEAAEAVHTEFSEVPDLRIISIEDPDEQTLEDIKKYRAEKEANTKKETLN